MILALLMLHAPSGSAGPFRGDTRPERAKIVLKEMVKVARCLEGT